MKAQQAFLGSPGLTAQETRRRCTHYQSENTLENCWHWTSEQSSFLAGWGAAQGRDRKGHRECLRVEGVLRVLGWIPQACDVKKKQKTTGILAAVHC